MIKTALVIPVYKRAMYLRKCLASLERLTKRPDVIIFVNDASPEAEVSHLVTKFVEDKNAFIYLHNKNSGIRAALLTGCEAAFTKHGCDIVINLDSDAVVSDNFITRLVALHKRLKHDYIVGGFNNPANKPSAGDDTHVYTELINGINMCFNRAQYEAHIKPSLLITGNWDYNTSQSARSFAITRPSCVQHIGLRSSMGHVGADVAPDFKLKALPDVTLFGIDSFDKAGILRAADITETFIQFGARKIITDDLFTKGGTTAKRREDYSRFMLKELTNHFDTSHVLTIHADGYVVNCDAWDDRWLEYDYIGATWGYKDGMNVGNGGFSLRSKKLCDILAVQRIDPQFIHPEDHHIARTFRPSLERDFGIKFAPEDVANKFSIEAYGSNAFNGGNLYSGQFGFHGVHLDWRTADKYGINDGWCYKKTKK